MKKKKSNASNDKRQRLWFGQKYTGQVIANIAKYDAAYLKWFLLETDPHKTPLFREQAAEVIRVLNLDVDLDQLIASKDPNNPVSA